MQLTIVIPTYNEAQNLPRLIEAIFSTSLPAIKILIVDDASPDGTAEIAENMSLAYPMQIGVLRRSGKMGLGTAYIAGFQHALRAGAEAITQMDADFSHPPDKLVEMAAALESVDVVMGSRYIPGGNLDQHWPLWRKGLSTFGNLYARTILRLPIHDATGGFRMWRKDTLMRMPLERVRSNGYAFQVEMAYIAFRLGFSFKEIPFYFADRQWGTSKMSLAIQLEAASRVWLMLSEYRDLNPSRNSRTGAMRI